MTTAENTKAIAQLGTKVDRLADSVGAQAQSLDRLERAVTNLVAAVESQRQTMADMVAQHSEFFKTTNKALDIIAGLTGQGAA